MGIKVEELVCVVFCIGERWVYVYEGEKEVVSYFVVVGKLGWEIFKGNFKVI